MKGRLRTKLGMVLMLGAALITPMNDPGGAADSINLDVLFVLDHSDSMKQNDLQRLVIRAPAVFLGRLGPNDAAGLAPHPVAAGGA